MLGPIEERSIQLPAAAIDGPWRADSYGAKLLAGRNASGAEELKLIDHSAMGIFGDLRGNELREMLRHFSTWVERQPDSIISIGSGEEGFRRVESEVEALELTEALLGYSRSYAELLHSARMSWSPNGKYLFCPLYFSPELFVGSEVTARLLQAIELASSTTLRIALISEDPRKVPPQLREALSWQAFLGEKAESYFRDRYAMAVKPAPSQRVPIGIAFDRIADAARGLSSLSYEPRGEVLARKSAMKKDAESYEKFLGGLTDGS